MAAGHYIDIDPTISSGVLVDLGQEARKSLVVAAAPQEVSAGHVARLEHQVAALEREVTQLHSDLTVRFYCLLARPVLKGLDRVQVHVKLYQEQTVISFVKWFTL